MNILGISALYHDSAAALLVDGEIIAAAQEERFSRKKHDPSFPVHAIRYCLEEGGVAVHELDAVVFYDKPFLKFERLLETYYNFAPKGFRSFVRAIPVWVREKLFLKRFIRKQLKEIDPSVNVDKIKILFAEHHLSHAASAFYPSPFAEAAILTLDGVGEWATASIGFGHHNKISTIKELHFPHSPGLFYSAFTYFLGFKVNSGEYKLMGLAPYGNPGSEEVKKFIRIIEERLIRIQADGSLWLNQDYFSYATGLRMVPERKWAALFGFDRRDPAADLEEHHCNLALAVQEVTEKIVMAMAAEAKRLTGSTHLCLAGGVALNCVANGALLRSGLFRELFIQPAAGDAGGALGAALACHYIYFKRQREIIPGRDSMRGAFLGPEFSGLDIERTARKYKAPYAHFADFGSLAEQVAQLLNDGKVVGWFQGKMEFGPRSLGNRSILADARNPEMQLKVNLKIKAREGFRPFAPAVLEEDCSSYFELDRESPYMLLVAPVRRERRFPLPDDYPAFSIRDKLYFQRSDIPAVTHVDFSARVQTVHADTNPRFHGLLKAFKEKTGCGLLLNTSFNVRGEPVVCTPDDAFRCFFRTEMDYLVLGDYLFDKSRQELKEKTEWEIMQEQFADD